MLQHPCSDRHAVQVLVYHDLLGMMQHPHYVKVTPKFCKQYASVGTVIQEALQSYRDEVGHPPALLRLNIFPRVSSTFMSISMALTLLCWAYGGASASQ